MTTIRVPSDAPTIQLAMLLVTPGDTIEVEDTYSGPESVLVTVPGLTLTATSSTTGIALQLGILVSDIQVLGDSDVSVTGNSLDNLIGSGSGSDTLNGGFGSDTVSYSAAAAAVSVDLSISGIAQDTGSAGMDTLSHFENLVGSAFDDTLTGSSADNVIEGGTGADTIDGGLGDDTMIGGRGNDTYFIDSLGDQVIELSGEGFDIVLSRIDLDISGLSISSVEVFQLIGTATDLRGTSTGDTLIANQHMESIIRGRGGDDTITGGDFRDILVGGEGDDVISGGDGADRLDGEAGNDTIEGGAGNDDLFGSTGDDRLDGGSGGDELDGGAGRDLFTGGDGPDTFIFSDGDMAGTTSSSADRILDFSQSDGDVIDLSGLDAILGGGDDAFSFIGDAAFSGTAGELRYEMINGNTVLFMDIDGDGNRDYALRLNGEIDLAQADFVL